MSDPNSTSPGQQSSKGIQTSQPFLVTFIVGSVIFWAHRGNWVQDPSWKEYLASWGIPAISLLTNWAVKKAIVWHSELTRKNKHKEALALGQALISNPDLPVSLKDTITNQLWQQQVLAFSQALSEAQGINPVTKP